MIEMPSPNFNKRPENIAIKSVIIHATGMDTAEAALKRLCDPEAQVSAHYTIDRDGKVYRHVHPEHRAWHAGISKWGDLQNFNDFSIGIELVNPGRFSDFDQEVECGEGYSGFPAAQIDALITVLKDLYKHYPIEPRLVLGHSDISPDRRKDPGYLFPWDRLVQENLAIRV